MIIQDFQLAFLMMNVVAIGGPITMAMVNIVVM